jgi:outer membrane protein insertion porin family
VKVSPPAVTRTGNTVSVRFSIEEGSQYTVKSLDVYEELEGMKKPPLGGWKSTFKPGDLFRRREFSLDLQWLRRIYEDQGYADVVADPETRLDEPHREITIVVPIVRGAVKSFGRIRFEGISRVPEETVRKEIAFHEGERFSTTVLERSLKHLRKIGWFYEVNLSTRNAGPDVVDVTIEVSERSFAAP